MLKINMDRKNKKQSFYIFILFLINPFIALLTAMKNYSFKYSKNIVWLFCGYYGYTFLIKGTSSDAFIHVREFIDISQRPNYGFFDFLQMTFNEEADLVIPLLKYVVSRFSEDPKILLLFLGLFFGYFFSRNVWILLSFTKKNTSFLVLLIILLFSFIYAPWEINAFRFPLATHIFVYGMLQYYLMKNKKGLIFVFLSPLVHFAIVYPILIYLIYLLIGNKLGFYLSILFLSMLPFSLFNLTGVMGFLPDTGVSSIEARKKSYTDEEYVTLNIENDKKKNWYVLGRIYFLKIVSIFIILRLLFKTNKNERSQIKGYSLLCYGVLLMAITNFMVGQIASVQRFNHIAQMLFLTFFVIYFINKNSKKIIFSDIALTISAIIYIIVDIRTGFYSMSVDTLLSNPLVASIVQSEVNMEFLINLVK